MGLLAIIGGSGSGLLNLAETPFGGPADTPYGPPSAPIQRIRLSGRDLLFLSRHGPGHDIPPHRINYRANLWALRAAGAGEVLALAAVGGIAPGLGPRGFAVPHQIIDYTYGREQSLHDGEGGGVVHIDFTEPYCEPLRARILAACVAVGIPASGRAVYGATQGPRLETAAEIARLERDGCDLVGMTGMPEAALARELGLCYATLAFVVNWAAGKGGGAIRFDELEGHLAHCVGRVGVILSALVEMGGNVQQVGGD